MPAAGWAIGWRFRLHYAVWGGVPRYWEVCEGERDLWETIRDEVFSPNGLFHEEPNFVLKDDLEGAGLNRQPLEVDVVAESSDGKTLLVGEAKLKLTKLESEHALAELEAKAKLLPFAAHYKKVVCRLFVAENARAGEVSLDWIDDKNRA